MLSERTSSSSTSWLDLGNVERWQCSGQMPLRTASARTPLEGVLTTFPSVSAGAAGRQNGPRDSRSSAGLASTTTSADAP